MKGLAAALRDAKHRIVTTIPGFRPPGGLHPGLLSLLPSGKRTFASGVSVPDGIYSGNKLVHAIVLPIPRFAKSGKAWEFRLIATR